MKRTGFLLAAVLVVTVAFALSAAAKTTRRVVDVLIIGGTTSGTTAAVAAARQGVTTLVVESTPMLGGMFTAQGVPAVDGNANLPSGLWNEFREALRAHYGGAPALATGWVSNTLFEPHVADSIFKAMAAAEPALSVEYGFRPVKVFRRGRKVSGARFVDKAGNRLEVSAEVTVDASTLHDGDFAGLAAFQGCYSYIALTRRNGRTMLTVQYKPANDDSIFSDDDWDSPAVTDAEIMADADCMRLRAVYDFTDCKDEVTFFYRDADMPESEWRPLGTAHRMVFKMDHFTGCRIGLFLYSTKETGGIADFCDFAYSTPDTKEREQ